MPSIRDHLDEFSALVSRTAEHRQIEAAFVEKDSWAIEILHAATIDRLVIDRNGNTKDVQAHLGLADEDCKLEGSTTGLKRYVRFHYAVRQNQAGNSRADFFASTSWVSF